MHRSRRAPASSAALAAATLVLLSGCGAEGTADRWAGSVDTLAGGGVVVHNPAEGIWDSASAWRLEEQLRIGAVEGSGPEVFSRISDLAIGADGRVYVLERSSHAVKVFDRTGAHLRTLGREGGGPGEFGDPIGLAIGPEERLWVMDAGNNRYALFDTAGTHVRDYRRQVSGYGVPWPGKLTGDGVMYDLVFVSDGGEGVRRVLVGFAAEGEELVAVDSVTVPPDPFPREQRQFQFRSGNTVMTMSIPWAPGVEWWLDPAGHLWFGRSDRYRLVQRTLRGDTVKVVERDWEPVPVTDRDREENGMLRRIRDENLRADLSRIPDVKPAFRRFRADGTGHLWVLASAPADAEVDPVDVFDPDGRYLGRLGLAADFRRSAIRDDRVCGVDVDDLGVEYVVCFGIDR